MSEAEAKASSGPFLFFSGASPLSNFHVCSFALHGHQFHSTEQYMMWRKARLFEDHKTADKILQADTPLKCKRLGRTVKPFKPDVWDAHKDELVYTGLLAKFEQNPGLARQLLETHPRPLGEASPYDRVWGIGLAKTHPNAADPSKWPGQNLLGHLLERVRSQLRVQQTQSLY